MVKGDGGIAFERTLTAPTLSYKRPPMFDDVVETSDRKAVVQFGQGLSRSLSGGLVEGFEMIKTF